MLKTYLQKRPQHLFNLKISPLHKAMSKYFFNCRGQLSILDGGESKRGYYTGVKLPYIEKYVLQNKFTRSEIAEYILLEHSKNKLHALFCPDVVDVVIHPPNGQVNYVIDGNYGYKNNTHYKHFTEHLILFKNGEI